MFKDKGLFIGILVTVLLIVGGVFFFTKDNTNTETPTVINKNILVPEGEDVTSGFSEGVYLPATESAKVTLVEFGDYECPACGVYHPFIKQLLSEYAGRVNFAFRNFPLSQHANAQISSQAAEAASLQGKYWQMHDRIFETQAEWSKSKDAKSIFISYAESLGLDMNKFKEDIESNVVKNNIKRDTADGGLVNLNATPTYYINGLKLDPMPSNYAGLKSIIESELTK